MSLFKDVKTVVLSVGVFDCFHEGHADLLARMREAGERSYVIIHDDLSTFRNKKRFPIQPLGLRRQNVMATGLVDHVEDVYSPDPSPIIDRAVFLIRDMYPGATIVYLRGDDKGFWGVGKFPGQATLERHGIEIRFKKYLEGVSTTMRRDEKIDKTAV